MKYPGIYRLDSIIRLAESCGAQIGNAWVPARPLGFPSWRQRWRAAWLVWGGRADAVIWPGDQ
jgi:hypothetical protein